MSRRGSVYRKGVLPGIVFALRTAVEHGEDSRLSRLLLECQDTAGSGAVLD